MMVPLWVAQLAREFWVKAKSSEPFPRRLLGPIARAFEFHVAFLPDLTIGSILKELQRLGIRCDLRTRDRFLHGCVVAQDEQGFAFIDRNDPEDERRFSLAHELAHFLRDYLLPRRRVRERVGANAVAVLDGVRPATVDERFHAMLGNAPLEFHFHFLERDSTGRPPDRSIADAEESADRLAYELLAPAAHVAATIARKCRPPRRESVVDLLIDDFGLPARQAAHYAGLLLDLEKEERVDPFLASLKIARRAVEL